MKFGLWIPQGNVSQIVRQGVLADKYDFDYVFLGDHAVHLSVETECPELWTTLTAIATQTKQVTVCSCVTDLQRRHPSTTAQVVATISALSQGRVALGLGYGEAMNLVPFGIEHNPSIKELREGIDIIRLLWRSGPQAPVNYEGKHFKLENAFLTVRPAREIPIFVGAIGPQSRVLAGEIGDGWLPWVETVDSYRDEVRDVLRGVSKAGKTRDSIRLFAHFYTAIGKDKQSVAPLILPRAKAALVTETRLLTRYGVKPFENYALHSLVGSKKLADQIRFDSSRIPDEIALKLAAYGTVDDCLEVIEGFVKAGADGIIIRNAGPDPEETIKIYSREILPYFDRSQSTTAL